MHLRLTCQNRLEGNKITASSKIINIIKSMGTQKVHSSNCYRVGTDICDIR